MPSFLARTLFLLLVFVSGAQDSCAADRFLDPSEAFQLSTRALEGQRLELTFRIAPGYYLYRSRFAFASSDARIGTPEIPPGDRHYDAALAQEVETYHGSVVVILPVAAAGRSFTLTATNQGCAERGLCYPPQSRSIAVTLKAFGAEADAAHLIADPDGAAIPATGAPDAIEPPAPAASAALATDALAPDDGRLTKVLRGGNLAMIVPIFFVAGLLLSLTPCVLPMVPILSSIIVGQGETVTRWRGFTLALAYALGMALLYTALGVAAGLLGEGLAAWLQRPWVLGSFAGLLVLLSLSMFGVFELQLPSALRDRLSGQGDRMRGGRHAGVFAMGGISALVVSPCVAAPLAAALLHISQTGDAVLGGVALFALAMGMSVPLLLVGASASALLPRAGAWMERVKHVFGLLLIAVAIYTVQPVLPAIAAMACWGTLLTVGGATLGAFDPSAAGSKAGLARTFKGLGLVLALMGALQFVGIASGGRDPAQPLARITHSGAGADGASTRGARSGPLFERVTSIADLDQRLQTAARPVLLDFYADWCVSCKEMDGQTLADPALRERLAKALLLRVDVTANLPADRALLKQFQLFGPPAMIFFDSSGREILSHRVVGFEDVARFSASLAGAGL